MNTVAIWYEGSASGEEVKPELHLHINHWKLRFNKSYFIRLARRLCTITLGRYFNRCVFHNNDYFIDFGLKIHNGSSVDNICIYIPGEFSETEKLIEDIGSKLNDQRLITAVFNEPYNTSTVTDAKYFVVSQDGTPLFNIYRLDIKHDIKLFKQFNGTIIKFPCKIFNNLPTYYRFRLKAIVVSNFSYIYKPSNSFLESAYSSIEIIDFRINDTRNMEVSLLEHIGSQFKFNISLVHYFVMRTIKDEYIVSNEKLNSVRQLEDKTWASYINSSEHHYEKSFAYHLKKESKEGKLIEEFSAVLKFRFEDNKIVKYFLWLIIFALLTEVFGSSIYDNSKDFLQQFYKVVFELFKKEN